MKSLVERNPSLKIAAIAILFIVSYFGFNSAWKFIGYLSLFGGLFVLFEGFRFSLFVKILSALVLGLVLALISMNLGWFQPEDLAAIKPVGSKIFMNCLTMALVPLVFLLDFDRGDQSR